LPTAQNVAYGLVGGWEAALAFGPDGVRVRVAQVKRESPGMRGTTTRSITRMRRNSKSERVVLMRPF